MQLPFELILGWRYTRAGRATRRNGFISFISGVSMLGIALGVAALIIVLSVMNGFQKEVRDRMLGVISHIEVFAPNGAALPDPQKTLAEIKANQNVVGAATFIAAQALLARGDLPVTFRAKLVDAAASALTSFVVSRDWLSAERAQRACREAREKATDQAGNDLVIATYKTPIVNLLEVGLVGAVLYHALNGLRVIAVDFWSRGPRFQKQMLWGVVGVWVVVMIPGTYYMMRHTVEALFGATP